MEGASWPVRCTLLVERFRLLHRLRVERHHRVELGPLVVKGLDPGQVLLDELTGRHLASLHGRGQFQDGFFRDVKRWRGSFGRRPARNSRHGCQAERFGDSPPRRATAADRSSHQQFGSCGHGLPPSL